MVFHTLVIDVNTCTCSGRSVVEIPQGSKNSHQLLIKLVRNNKPYSIGEGFTPEITFYDSFDHELFTSLSAQVANHYRGYVTYVVGPRLVRDFGRYIGHLDLYDPHHDRRLSVRFVVNVTKTDFNDNGCGCGCNDASTEVIVTREFYKELSSHLRDNSRHLTDSDRSLLDFVAENKATFITFDNMAEALENDPEIRSVVDNLVKEAVDEELGGVDFQKVIEASEKITETSEKVDDLEGRVQTLEKTVTWNTSLL